MKTAFIWLGRLAAFLGLSAFIFLLLQGPGYQAGWWDIGTSFRGNFPKIVIAGGLAILLGTLAFIGPRFIKEPSVKLGLIGVIAGLSAAIVPISIKKTAESVPPIHDITTDTRNPPAFVDMLELRKDAPNPASYDPAIAQQQLDAYPDLQTLELSASNTDVFSAALKVVDSFGWDNVSSDVKTGRIEATDTTTWYGFKDDVVIRIQASGAQTLVDVRSKSRLGKSDLGANAKRIRKFLDALQSRVN
ncbi:MAG: DUF1499 domain-containing protein [Gammaproteobacteria bacterium]|nr:DUF1499 domain-containing protein [Gammaproteobacteria bacterium]NNC96515.1 DUF1499 domain-containing protein [Gammaproteobacteria bacterium]NNM12750.1 DUF1499 domain-containing protein [Gammaproteobacteria bacterium]